MKENFHKNYYKNYFFEEKKIESYDEVDWTNWAKDYIKDYKFNSFLDVGCGTGNLIKEIAKYGKFVMGIEISDYAIKKAISNNIPIVKLDISKDKFPFGDESFDVVYCYGVLEYLKLKEGILNAMREISRVCKNIIIFSARFDNDNMPCNKDNSTNKKFDFKSRGFWENLWKESGNKKKLILID